MKTLGKFEILEKVGQGAMGVVYKARDPLIGRLVALKTISSGLAEDTESLARFYQEARAAGTLQHPNIVTIFELGKEDDTPFIAMEFLEGASLDKLIGSRLTIPLSQKLGYIVHVCRAIEYAHKRGIVHRDIKPGNVMLTNEGTVKVVDFGIARLAESSRSQSGMLIGTLAYMSPQQIKGEHADATSDIWATGAMFYELISYRPPFEGHNYGALVMNILTQALPPLAETNPSVPLDVAAVVDRMLQKEVKARFQSMEEVLIELEPCWKRLQQAEVSGLVADAQQLLKNRHVEKALQIVRRALQIEPENTAARDLLEKINVEVRHTRSHLSLAGVESRQELFGAVKDGSTDGTIGENQETLAPNANIRPPGERQQAGQATPDPQETVQTLRVLIATGRLDDAAAALQQAVTSQIVSEADPMVSELKRQMETSVAGSGPLRDVQTRSAAAAASAAAFAPAMTGDVRPGAVSVAAIATPRAAASRSQDAPVPAGVPQSPVEVVRPTVPERRTRLSRQPVAVALIALAAIAAAGAGVYRMLRPQSPVAPTAQTAEAITPPNPIAPAAQVAEPVAASSPAPPKASVPVAPQSAPSDSLSADPSRQTGTSASKSLAAPALPPVSVPPVSGTPAAPAQSAVPAPVEPSLRARTEPSPAAMVAERPSAPAPVVSSVAVPSSPPPAAAAPVPPTNLRAEPPAAAARAATEPAAAPPVAGVALNNPDRQAIVDSIQQLSAAFSHRSMDELQQVWPKVGGAVRNNLKTAFESATSLARDFHIQSLTVANDGATATVIGTYEGRIRLRQGAESPSNGNFYVRLAKRNAKWLIDDASF